MNDNIEDQQIVPFGNSDNGRAIILYPHQCSNEVKTIMKNYVCSNSTTRYMYENIQLMLWLFDTDAETYLYDWVVKEALLANDLDLKNTSKKRKNLKNPLNQPLKIYQRN